MRAATAMGIPAIGDEAPQFDLPGTGGADVSLSSFRDKQPVVLLFYRGDFTAVCAKQMCEVRDAFRELTRLEAQILGISTDDLDAHERFREAHRLPFKLLSDTGGWVARRYGVMGWLGRRSKRASFVIDKRGIVRYAKVHPALFPPKVQEIATCLSALRRREP